MAKDFNYTLIELARTAEIRTNKVIDELQQAATDTRLNYDAQQADLNAAVDSGKTDLEDLRARGLEAIRAKCAELDQREAEARRTRALDTEYQQRLSSKLDTLARIDTKAVNTVFLKDYVGEFAGDPVAISAIKAALNRPVKPVTESGDAYSAAGNMSADFGLAGILTDHTGELQAHIRDTVKRSFENLIDACLTAVSSARGDLEKAHGKRDAANSAVDYYRDQAKQRVNAFCEYCRAQDPDFSLDDVELMKARDEKIRAERGEEPTGAAGQFDFQFKPLHNR